MSGEDNELKQYKIRVGADQYDKEYHLLYIKSKSNKRHSGRRYDNPPEKLQELKEKYKNGVPAGEVEKWLNEL